MNLHLKLEDAALFLLFSAFFLLLPIPWWWYPVLLLAPDLGMIGYVVSPRMGAITYNTLHSRLLGGALVLVCVPSWMTGTMGSDWSLYAAAAGFLLLAHASMDRMLGYGLKYSDSFTHTHLGTIGKARNTQ